MVNETLDAIALRALSKGLAGSDVFPQKTAREILPLIVLSCDLGYAFHEYTGDLEYRLVRTFTCYSVVVYDTGGRHKDKAIARYRRDMKRFGNSVVDAGVIDKKYRFVVLFDVYSFLYAGGPSN